MKDKLELLDVYLREWQSENERIAKDYESSEFIKGVIYAIDKIKLEIQNLKKNDN